MIRSLTDTPSSVGFLFRAKLNLIRMCFTLSYFCAQLLSCVQLFVTLWTAAPQAPLSLEILEARMLERVAVPSSRGSSQPRDQTQVSHIASGFFTSWVTREAQEYWSGWPIPSPGELPSPGIKPGSRVLQAVSLPA